MKTPAPNQHAGMLRAEGCQESANLEFLNTYPWILAPAIFFARLLDVTLGTFRTIVVFRGYPALAAAIGFVEILIWVAAVSQVLREISDWPLVPSGWRTRGKRK